MREFCRQVEKEVVSKSRKKIHQTWGLPISGALFEIQMETSYVIILMSYDSKLSIVFDAA